MTKRVFDSYKFTLLISLAVFVAILAIRVEKDIPIILTFLGGALLGGLLLEADYFIHAYFVDPASSFGQNLTAYIKHKDISGALLFINEHKGEIPDKTLNSAIFQIVLFATSIFVCGASTSLFMKAFVLSAFANSIYRSIEEYYAGRINQWFWAFKTVPDLSKLRLYYFVLAAGMVFCLFVV